MSDLAADLWSTLPSELVERVLSFLSAPVLCRFRTVSKRWNSLICKPAFGALCIHHARQDPRFIVIREAKRWCLLDMSARRWYTIQHDEHWNWGIFESGIGTVTMDGGLVCQLSSASPNEDTSVYVSSPIARTSRRLPPCTAMAGRRSRPVLDMVFDTVALTYNIFLIPDGAEIQPLFRGGRHFMINTSVRKPPISEENPFMVIYESATNLWRNATILHTPLQGLPSRATCSVFFEGLLYVLMSPFWSYDISEVHIGDRICSTVFEMQEAAMNQVLGMPSRDYKAMSFTFMHFKAFGCSKSIVLLCGSTRRSILDDLSTSLWEVLPCNPGRLGALCSSSGTMNLILPGNALWDSVAGNQS